MRLTPIAITYLELACYGMTPAEIAKRHGLRCETAVARIILTTAREVGRMGFWKFHVRYVSEIPAVREQLLRKLSDFGYLRAAA